MDVDERIAKFSELKERFPDQEQPRWSLATAYEDAERYEDAMAELRGLLEIKPDYTVAWIHLGSCQMELDQPEEALESLKRGHELAVQQGHTAPIQEAEMLLEQVREDLED